MATALSMHTGATATGNGNSLDVAGAMRAAIQISGTFKGLIVFEGTIDGINWVAVPFTNETTERTWSGAEVPGAYSADVSAFVSIRARIAQYTSGSITVAGHTNISAALAVVTATIANGQSLSDAVDLGGRSLVRIIMPVAWTAAALTFQTSMDLITYGNLYKPDGSEYSVTSGQDQVVVVPPAEFANLRGLKIRSGLSGAAQNQSAVRDILLVVSAH